MTEFEFFTDTDFTDRSILPIFDSLEDQNDYFDAQTKIEKEGNFKGFNNPIILFEPLETCIGLSYFRFKINDKWYYAITTDVAQDTPGKTILSYRLDYWQTARYQFDIRLGRGYVSRSSHAPKGLAHRDARYTTIKPVKIDYTSYALTNTVIVFFARDHNTNENYVGIIGDWDNESEKIFNSTWTTELNIDPGDVIGVWFMPLQYSIYSLYTTYGWTRFRSDELGTPIQNSTVLSKTTSTNLPALPLTRIVEPAKLKQMVTDAKTTYVIRDMDGSIVYQFEMGRDYSNNEERGLFGIFDISPTSAALRIVTAKASSPYTSAENIEPICTVYGQSLDFFVDSYQEYFARNRQFDLETRANNITKSISSSIGSAGAGAVEGALSGALIGAAGGPIGALGGAAVGGIAGIATSIIGGAIDANYNNPREQESLDRFYKQQTDALSITGSHLHLLSQGNRAGVDVWPKTITQQIVTCFGIYEVSVDPITANEIDEDIATYGEYCSIATADGEDWLLPGALRGEFVIKGNVPESWKGEVQRNIASGVTIKKYEV